jgi:hypothetical protein
MPPLSKTLGVLFATLALAVGAVGAPGSARTPREAANATGATTIDHETANNTSAASAFAGQSNGNEPASNISKVALRTLLPAGYKGKIFIHYMPWWGNRSHPDIGYSEHDAGQVRRQVEDMISRGFDGVIVAEWNTSDFSRETTDKLFRECEAHSFLFAIQGNNHGYRRGADPTNKDPTGKLVDDLSYAAKNYFRSPVYYKVNGRPVVYFFDPQVEGLDWRRAQERVEGHPLFIFRNRGAFKLDYSDGGFAWIGLATEGDPEGLKYLEDFYKEAGAHRAMYTLGAGWKGFDDHLASWGKNRLAPQACGQTWLKSFTLASRMFPAAELPDIGVNTWNDYEEGTEIETGIDNCASIGANVEGHELRLDPRFEGDGTEDTVDHYEVFVSSDGRDLRLLVRLRAGEHRLDLAGFHLAPGRYSLLVKMIGRPLIRNHLSEPVPYTVSE